MTSTLEVRLTDAVTGEPITSCCIVGYDEANTLTEVTPRGDTVAADGVYRFEHEPMSGRVRIAADGHVETWTSFFALRAGHDVHLDVRMDPLSHLVVRVLESDGSPVEEGTLLLTGPNRKSTMIVRNGLVDRQVDPGRAQVVVDPRFMEGYRRQAQPVTLTPGKRTDLTLHVSR